MFETTPPLPSSDAIIPGVHPVDLADPIAAVVAVELSRRLVGLCLSWAEPMVADLASQESLLRKPGGADFVERMLAQRFYRRIEPHVVRMLEICVPLEHAESALARLEEVLRGRFGEVVRTAASYLLSHDRDTAIQMVAVATTMAGRVVRADVADILIAARPVASEE
ncbi:MAG: hypothetical protein KDB50_07205 [Mycobacterium sp.]|nr:hypothetical protein [Mycobacterium sp.]